MSFEVLELSTPKADGAPWFYSEAIAAGALVDSARIDLRKNPRRLPVAIIVHWQTTALTGTSGVLDMTCKPTRPDLAGVYTGRVSGLPDAQNWDSLTLVTGNLQLVAGTNPAAANGTNIYKALNYSVFPLPGQQLVFTFQVTAYTAGTLRWYYELVA